MPTQPTQLGPSPAESQPPADDQPLADSTATEAATQEPGLFGISRLGEDSLLPGILFALGVLVAIVIMLRALRKRTASKPAYQAPEDRLASIHERAAASITPVERSMADAEALVRRMSATLDNKADRLELLIQEADQKLAHLNQSLAASGQTPQPTLSDSQPPRPRAIDPALLDRARLEQDRHERTPTDEPRPPSPPSAQDTVQSRIWKLADDGMPPVEIARNLNQPVGQVELILNLRKSG